MRPGGLTTGAPGAIEDQILDFRLDNFLGAARMRSFPMGNYRNKYYGVFVNGIYEGRNRFIGFNGQMNDAFQMQITGSNTGIFIEDMGDWSVLPSDHVPSGGAENAEFQMSYRAMLAWKTNYSITSVRGDTQLSSITITGAQRGKNVEAVPFIPTRGKLSYSINNIAGVRIVRFWNGQKIVCEGFRTGDGALVCYALDGSELQINCTVTYTGDVKAQTAYIEMRWPAAFAVNYSTSALVFPRTADATVYDDPSKMNYYWLTPELAAGTYHWTILEIDDNGLTQTAGIAAPSDFVIYGAPLPPVVTGVTGNAAALTVAFTNGEAGCTYMLYTSLANQPINFGNYALPAPVGPSALNATSAGFAVAAYAATDLTAAYATLQAAFDAAVLAQNTQFTAGQIPFNSNFDTMISALHTAINVWADACALSLNAFKENISRGAVSIKGFIAKFPTTLSASEWKDAMGSMYSGLLASLGAMLENNPARYALPNAAINNGGTGSATIGTGQGTDSTGRRIFLGDTLKSVAQPFIRNAQIRLVVRATKTGIQETNDAQYVLELTNAGAIVGLRPNRARVASITRTNGLTVAAEGTIYNFDSLDDAAYLDLYLVASTVDINSVLGSPQASTALSAAQANLQRASVSYTVAGAGHYKLALVARSAAGVNALLWDEYIFFVSSTAPGAPDDLEATVIRGKGGPLGN